MILDSALQLAASFAPTAVASNAAPNYLDLQAIMNAGMGESIIWHTQIATTFTSGGAGTLQLQLQGNQSDPAFGSGNITILDNGVLALATLVKGYEIRLKLPRIPITPAGNLAVNDYRYVRLLAIIGTAVMTGGVLNSWLMPDAAQDNRPYATGYTVL